MEVPRDFAAPGKPTSAVYGTAMGLWAGSGLRATMDDRAGSGHILVQAEKFGGAILGSP